MSTINRKDGKQCNRGITCHIGERSDEWYTLDRDVEKVLPYISVHMEKYARDHGGRRGVILCPFDCAESAFVRVLTAAGYDVEYGDRDHDGKDFFTSWDYSRYALIISNPPFSISNRIILTLLNDGAPFMLLTRYDGMLCARSNYRAVEKHNKTMALLMVRGKLQFRHQSGEVNVTPYYISWVCNNVETGEPEQVVFLD